MEPMIHAVNDSHPDATTSVSWLEQRREPGQKPPFGFDAWRSWRRQRCSRRLRTIYSRPHQDSSPGEIDAHNVT